MINKLYIVLKINSTRIDWRDQKGQWDLAWVARRRKPFFLVAHYSPFCKVFDLKKGYLPTYPQQNLRKLGRYLPTYNGRSHQAKLHTPFAENGTKMVLLLVALFLDPESSRRIYVLEQYWRAVEKDRIRWFRRLVRGFVVSCSTPLWGKRQTPNAKRQTQNSTFTTRRSHSK